MFVLGGGVGECARARVFLCVYVCVIRHHHSKLSSSMRHLCSSTYLYRCDDSLSNSKDASLKFYLGKLSNKIFPIW